jgi:hypothetical protein
MENQAEYTRSFALGHNLSNFAPYNFQADCLVPVTRGSCFKIPKDLANSEKKLSI